MPGKTGNKTDFCQAETKTEARCRVDSDRNLRLQHQAGDSGNLYQVDGDKNLCLQHQAGDSGNLHQTRANDTNGDVEF